MRETDRNRSLLTSTVIGVIGTGLGLEFTFFKNVGPFDEFIFALLFVLVVISLTSLYLNNGISKRVSAVEDFTDILLSAGLEAFEYYYGDLSEGSFERTQKHLINILFQKVNRVSQSMYKKYRDMLSPERMHELLEEYERGKINGKEALELKSILDQEKKKREETGDKTGSIIIGIIILGLLYLISKENRAVK